MHFSITPSNTSLDLVLAAGSYQRVWDENAAAILKSFYEVTGLTFQQEALEAMTYDDAENNAGTVDEPMHLSGRSYDNRERICTLVHELGHRLLGGNALGPVGLGLLPDSTEVHPLYQEYDHKHLYLFLFEVIETAFGTEMALWAHCDEVKRAKNGTGHTLALRWADNLTPSQKQHAIQQLAAEALPRERWHERDDQPIAPRDPKDWFRVLTEVR